MPATAEVILLPKKLRAEWMDVMALDLTLSPLDFRIACVVGQHFNRKTAETYIGQAAIARLTGLSERAVWESLKKLESRGYLIIQRRSLGEGVRITKDGAKPVKFAGGRGVANVYLPAFERSHLSATNSGAKLASQCDHYRAQRSQNPASMVAPQCDPTLTYPSGKNPNARERAREIDLGKEGEELRHRLGDETFASWFGQVSVEPLQAGETTLRVRAPTRFIADTVRSRFADDLLACWPRATGLKVEVRPQTAAVAS